MQKGKFALKVLEVLGASALNTAELIEVILASPYGASVSRFEAERRKIENRRSASRKERHLYDLLYRLQKDGFIDKKMPGRKNAWRPTPKGIQEIKKLRAYFLSRPVRKDYEKTADQELKIIAFDIPEKYKKKRWWLRETLKSLGFTMLQKSVWIGKHKLPKEFIEDAHAFGILSYVEILAVTKTGSVREVTY